VHRSSIVGPFPIARPALLTDQTDSLGRQGQGAPAGRVWPAFRSGANGGDEVEPFGEMGTRSYKRAPWRPIVTFEDLALCGAPLLSLGTPHATAQGQGQAVLAACSSMQRGRGAEPHFGTQTNSFVLQVFSLQIYMHGPTCSLSFQTHLALEPQYWTGRPPRRRPTVWGFHRRRPRPSSHRDRPHAKGGAPPCAVRT